MANSAWVYAKPIQEPFQRKEYRIVSASAGDDIAVSLDLGRDIEIEEVRVHLSGVEANTLTGTVNSDAGAGYDFVPVSQSMAAITDYRFSPTNPLLVAADASFDLALTTAGGITWNVVILVKE